ncbi:hypothetical protein SDC9_190645 [bioreactor metagenome]|uniref:Uncharacterized protein n=1 Tax=bioreactor metagenome TaxID=1076179 RepID=A0A645HWX0_9ZZZZ
MAEANDAATCDCRKAEINKPSAVVANTKQSAPRLSPIKPPLSGTSNKATANITSVR